MKKSSPIPSPEYRVTSHLNYPLKLWLRNLIVLQYRVGYETYRSWEEGRRFPSSPGYAVLVIAEQSPEAFIKNRKGLIKELKKYGL